METWEDAEDWNGITLFWALGALSFVLLVTAVRIHTYLISQDPYLHYFPLARDVVDANWSLVSIQSIAEVMAPGYPLILANLLEVVGSYATWVNTGFGLLWIVALCLLLWRVTDSIAAAILGTAGWFLLFLFADPLIPHFFLHPYRDGPAQTFVLLGLLALVLVPRRPLPLVTGVLLVLACGVREVAIIGFPVAAVSVCVLLPSTGRRQKVWRLVFLLTPVVLTLVAVAMVMGLGNRQVGSLLVSMSEGGFEAGAGILAALFRGPLWIVLPAFVLGVYALARQPALWIWLVLPAVLLWLLYATHSHHTRYFMSVLLWLAPLPGIGLWAVLNYLPEDHRSHTAALLSLSLVLVSGWLSFRLQPWGPVVSRADVETFAGAVQGRLGRTDAVVPCRGCRMGRAALDSYTTTLRGSVANIDTVLASGQKLFLLQPLTPEAVDAPSKSERDGLRLAEIALQYHDLTVQADTPPLALGPAKYQLLQVEPWSEQGRSNPVTLTPGQANWIMVDFRGQAPGVGRSIELRDAATNALFAWDASGRSGTQLLYVPARAAVAPTLYLHAFSSQPGPRQFVVGSTAFGKPVTLDGTAYRFLSTLPWFQGEGWLLGEADDKYGMSLFDEAELVIPMPVSLPVATAHVHLEFDAQSEAAGGPLEIWHGPTLVGTTDIHAEPRRNIVRIAVESPAGSELRLRLRPTDPEAFPLCGLKTLFLHFDPAEPER